MSHMFRRHKWMPFRVLQGTATNVLFGGTTRPITQVYYRCQRTGCFSAKTANLDGWWTLEELRGKVGS